MRDPAPSPLRQLADAPHITPPDTLWPRLRAGQRRALLRRRLATGATASAFVLVLVIALPWQSMRVGKPGPPAQLALNETTAREEIATLDRALQAAYDRGASDAEVAPMWEARHALASRITVGPGTDDPRRDNI